MCPSPRSPAMAKAPVELENPGCIQAKNGKPGCLRLGMMTAAATAVGPVEVGPMTACVKGAGIARRIAGFGAASMVWPEAW